MLSFFDINGESCRDYFGCFHFKRLTAEQIDKGRREFFLSRIDFKARICKALWVYGTIYNIVYRWGHGKLLGLLELLELLELLLIFFDTGNGVSNL